ncbi:rRNA (cytosine-C(5)-)-methyltransferase RsmF [Raoultella ornithinolytica]|nr:rRNA (cytosine-C(5)-)-methyltransferase RsmF [Raoultella ornithinolytica]
MTIIRSGSVIKRFGCSRKRWNHLSARSVFSRIGIRLAETHNKGFRWQHEAVIALAVPDAPFELTQDEAEEWYRGRDVYPETTPQQDEVIVTFQGATLGLAKKVGSRLKNSYPRELVRDGKLFAGKA